MTPGTHRFVVLDALRGLCAILVCLFHFHSRSTIATSGFVRASWQFVDFFFVLSGFVIAANYRERLAAGMSRWQFLGLRLGRIYPLHVFVLALFVVSELAALGLHPPAGTRQLFNATHPALAIPLHLLLLQSVGLLPNLTWNVPAWSISVEFWAYVAFALVVPLAGRRLEVVLAAVAVACPLILLVATPWGINVTWDWGLVRGVYGFALGVLCFAAWQRGGDRLRAGGTAVELLALAAVVTFVIVAADTRWNLLGPPLFAAAILIFAGESGRVSRLLSIRPLLFLGTISYSVYLLHSFIQGRLIGVLRVVQDKTGVALISIVMHRGLPVVLAGATPLQGTLLTVVMLLAVVVTSYATYRFVEQPALAWSRRAVRRMTAPQPVPASPA